MNMTEEMHCGGVEVEIVYQLIVLTIIIHLIDTLAYSVRLNSVKSGQVALSLSLFNVIMLISRTANTFQAPFIGTIVDYSIKTGIDPLPSIRKVIFAATIGTIIGIILIPTFLRIFSKAVMKLEVTGSVPSIVVQALSIANIKRIAKDITKPSKKMLEGLRFHDIQKRVLLFNVLVTGVYTMGVLAANYAAILVPDHRVAVASSSGIINGVATILLTLYIDPKAAIITDEAIRGKREYSDVKALVVVLIGTKLLGTLLAQVLIVPAAMFIARIYGG